VRVSFPLPTHAGAPGPRSHSVTRFGPILLNCPQSPGEREATEDRGWRYPPYGEKRTSHTVTSLRTGSSLVWG
jgi:hypothetical protein